MEGRVLLWDPLQLCLLAKVGGIGCPPGPGPWENFLSRRSTHVCSEIEVRGPSSMDKLLAPTLAPSPFRLNVGLPPRLLFGDSSLPGGTEWAPTLQRPPFRASRAHSTLLCFIHVTCGTQSPVGERWGRKAPSG